MVALSRPSLNGPMNCETWSLVRSFPCFSRRRMAYTVNGLPRDAMLKSVAEVLGVLCCRFAYPYPRFNETAPFSATSTAPLKPLSVYAVKRLSIFFPTVDCAMAHRQRRKKDKHTTERRYFTSALTMWLSYLSALSDRSPPACLCRGNRLRSYVFLISSETPHAP